MEGKRFCEIGCGLGITTHAAAEVLGAEAWGVDLSEAVFRAARQHMDRENLHFVQASVFALPLRRESFDFLYTHGVLHHTWSTKEAIRSAIAVLAEDSTLYIWLYGMDDVRVTRLRHAAYLVESNVRPVVARLPAILAAAVLWTLVPFYQIASKAGVAKRTHSARCTARQAWHAARDRFTPLFAHRHERAEVLDWLENEFGFALVERVSGTEVADSWSLAMERNVALRAHRTTPPIAGVPA